LVCGPRAVVERDHARAVALVGLLACGEDSSDSDCDFLVGFEDGITLFDTGDLEADIQDLLGASADVAPRSCV